MGRNLHPARDEAALYECLLQTLEQQRDAPAAQATPSRRIIPTYAIQGRAQCFGGQTPLQDDLLYGDAGLLWWQFLMRRSL